MFGPSAPRTRVAASSLSQSPRREPCRLRLPMRTPACCQPLGSGTVQRRAAVACRMVASFTECAGSSVVGRGTSVSNGSSIGRVLGVQPMLLETHNRRKTGTHKGRKNNEPRGVHPFVISNVLRTATRSRAALPSHNVQSFLPSPTT